MYIKKLSKNLLYFLFALLAIELASYSTLYFYYNIIKNSENERMVKYLRNFHPLVRENSELRAYEYVHEYAQILGYKLRPNFSYEKQGRTIILETDNYGFIHNGQKSKIHEVLNSNIEEKYLKIIFLGGSTLAGAGSSNNSHTIPAYFEKIIKNNYGEEKILVINAGVFGYNQTQERLYYNFFLRDLNPDIVVFFDGYNEIAESFWFSDVYFKNIKFKKHFSGWSHNMMNDEIYKDLFYASKNFQNFAKRVRRFPQPLYMISLFEIFFDKVNSYLPKKTKNYKAHYTPILSDQVERNLRDLTSIHIHETSDKKKETYMIFTLQPLITINKNFKTENEINLLKQIKMKNYKEIAKKYYNEFSSIYSNLDNEFSENNYVRFINLKDIFQNEKGNVYTSWAHYNDYGCKLIAQEIYNKLSNEIDVILKRKNNSF